MTVQELIDKLVQMKNKSVEVVDSADCSLISVEFADEDEENNAAVILEFDN